jgi:hypothetical protein
MAVVVFPTPPFWLAMAMTRPKVSNPKKLKANLSKAVELGKGNGCGPIRR